MDFLSVTKYLTLSVIYSLKTYVKTFQKIVLFLSGCHGNDKGLLLAKHGNERNYNWGVSRKT